MSRRIALVLWSLCPLFAVACSRGPTAPPGAASAAEPVASGPSQRAAPRHAGLRLATWNLAWLNEAEGDGPVRRSAEDYERLRRYAERIDADIVAFQEVDGERAAARVFAPERYALAIAAERKPQRTGFAYEKHLRVTRYPDHTALDLGGDLRAGVDIGVALDGGSELRLLAVHLKSGCHQEPLGTPGKHCEKFARQLVALEAWIDARAAEGVPFAVLGDFNRRFFARPAEPSWTAIDDADPPEADLFSPTEGKTARCWDGAHPHFVDHLVFSRSAARLLDLASFQEHVYDAADARHKRVLSDHCPLSIALAVTPLAGGSAPEPRAAARAEPANVVTAPAGSVTPATAGEAPIKGNISAKGKKLYHRPDCPSYAATRIDESRGERFFATEAEAQAAGWTRAPNCP